MHNFKLSSFDIRIIEKGLEFSCDEISVELTYNEILFLRNMLNHYLKKKVFDGDRYDKYLLENRIKDEEKLLEEMHRKYVEKVCEIGKLRRELLQ